MSIELISSALGLPPDRWPPDHYTLLGLPAGVVDAAQIEERVLERMERLRPYQLAHPDTVTDAMNRLAQALVCLTDSAAKAAYDATLQPATVPPAPPTPLPLAPEPPVPVARLELPALPPVAVLQRPPVVVPRRGNAARRLVYRRIAVTRRLLAAWHEAGALLADRDRRLQTPGEAVTLVSALWELRAVLSEEDGLGVGAAGQPGALVAALARQALPLHTFRHLLPGQRQTLAADWRAGRDRIAEVYQALQRQARRMRRPSLRRVLARAARSLATDHVDLLLFVLALLALGVALYRSR